MQQPQLNENETIAHLESSVMFMLVIRRFFEAYIRISFA